jgi:hypothetical protein
MQALTFTPMSSAGGLSLRDVKAPTSVDDGRGGLAKLSNNCTYLPACLPTCLPTCDALEIPRTWAEPMRPMHSAAAACIEKRDAPLMLTRSLARSLTHARTHALTHSLARSLTHSPTHSPTGTKCCSGGGAPFEVTFDKDPAGARLAGRNLTWSRLPRGQILIGQDPSGHPVANMVTLKLGQELAHGAGMIFNTPKPQC